jgi:UDP-N-acetylglucosamine 2-epimerase (non-hydrolysing)
MKAAPVMRALGEQNGVSQVLVHTGQHYDASMSEVFFQQLGMPEPDVNLRVGSGSHAQQTGEIMMRFEPLILDHRPHWVLVYGDVNSTVAAALVCAKMSVRVAHVEAGLRSFDRTMPEEVNRLLTDQLADLLFTPSQDGNDNLIREGIPPDRIRLVGNVMIDSLVRLLPHAKSDLLLDLPRRYLVATMHRPTNVDDREFLGELLTTLRDIANSIPVVFPVHPRTRRRLAEFGLDGAFDGGIRLTEPLPYLEFLTLVRNATAVITDSGGIQEETTFLRVPCLTVRDNTERPITTTLGTNVLVGRNIHRLRDELNRVLVHGCSERKVPPMWDGNSAKRIAREILNSDEGDRT